MSDNKNLTKVVTGSARRYDTGDHSGLVRFSYCSVWEPKAANENAEPKYSVSLIIPKDDTKLVNKIKSAIQAANEYGIKAKFNGKDLSKRPTFHNPLRDGDAEKPDDEAYKNSYFVNASSKNAPGIIDKDGNHILDQTEFYSGCYGFASVNFYPYNTAGSSGIACGLQNLQKFEDGEPLGGRSSAESDFGVENQDDDF